MHEFPDIYRESVVELQRSRLLSTDAVNLDNLDHMDLSDPRIFWCPQSIDVCSNGEYVTYIHCSLFDKESQLRFRRKLAKTGELQLVQQMIPTPQIWVVRSHYVLEGSNFEEPEVISTIQYNSHIFYLCIIFFNSHGHAFLQ